MKHRLILTLPVLALLGAGCISFTSTPEPTPQAPAEVPAPVTTSAAEEPPAPQVMNAMVITDQVAATTTHVPSVTLATSGYISIHSDVNGVLGPIIGQSALLNAGTAANVTIDVPVTDGVFYWAVLHTDDGDGIFDATKDPPTKDANGTVIMQRFTATK